MSVKIAFSLGAGGERPPVIPTHDRANDFKSRLGLPTTPLNTQSVSDIPEKGVMLFSEDHTYQQSIDVTERGEVAATKLYELGLQAGIHLSYLTSQLNQFDHELLEKTAEQPSLPVSPLATSTVSNLAMIDAQLNQQPTGHWRNQITIKLRSNPISVDVIQRETSALIAARLPEKRWQLLGDHERLSLVVRDYFMSEAERTSVLEDLLHRLADLGVEPTNVWLNGQVFAGGKNGY